MQKHIVVNASRGSIQKYVSLKTKLYKCNANIYFNKQCLKRQQTPSYANIKAPTPPQTTNTQNKLPAIRIKDELKYLHAKKQEINIQLYHLHIYLANSHDKWWPHIQYTIQEKIHNTIMYKYKALDKKLHNLTMTQKTTTKHQHTSHPRVLNNTNIPFSDNEMNLFHKGLKYNIHAKMKNWIQTLALLASRITEQVVS